MDAEHFAATQEGLVARWGLLDLGWTSAQVRWWSKGLRAPFPGVYLTGWGPMTVRQHCVAATLTTPDSHLSHWSAAAAYGMRDDQLARISIVRPGDGGPRDVHGLRITYSTTLIDHVTLWTGLRLTTPERTVIDLWPALPTRARRHRLVREALRLERTTPRRLLAVIRDHRGRRGVADLRRFVERYSHLPFHRCRSDAEAYALTVLDDAGVEIPMVNTRHAGEEADFCWFPLRRILEIDGPQFHLFADVDARKTKAWRAAGFVVDRLPSTALYADRRTLLALAPAPTRSPTVPLWLP